MARQADSWGFYGRRTEQAELRKIIDSGRFFFCSVTGRRRIGKTSLVQEAMKESGRDWTYFQVPDSDERGVVEAFVDMLRGWSEERAGVFKSVNSLGDIAACFQMFTTNGVISVIDEFQFFHQRPLTSFQSALQSFIDKLRARTDQSSLGGLFVLGSIQTEMEAILENRNSPLFARLTHKIELGHWDFATLLEMWLAHGVTDPAHWLFHWTLFEGVPKFYRDAWESGVLNPGEDYRAPTMRRLFFEGTSPLRDEAETWFLREMHGRYDSLLRLIARSGPVSLGQLTAEYERAGGGASGRLTPYLDHLANNYRMIEKLEPIFAGRGQRQARYALSDNFLSAWLAALARNVGMARVQPIDLCVDRADQALQSHEGHVFEKMVRQLTEECSRKAVGDFSATDLVRGYWNKADGSDIEIDLVAVNENDRIVRFGTCKRSESKHTDAALRAFDDHVDRFLKSKTGRRFADWRVERAVYAPALAPDRRAALADKGYIARDLRDYAAYLGFNV